jgi:hypothetical protein
MKAVKINDASPNSFAFRSLQRTAMNRTLPSLKVSQKYPNRESWLIKQKAPFFLNASL